ncbi:MAG: glycosyltransferase [Lachnospiraceae bacterium]|nr:glycosyltransferase [Lachnospiraceae bacterium]
MGRLRILQIIGEINGGGVGAVVYNYLSHMNRRDMQIDILAFGIDGVEEQLQESKFRDLGCRVFFLPHRNKGYRRHFSEYRRLIRDGRYDIVHCHFELWSAPYLAIARTEGVGVRIAHCHIAASEYAGMKARLLRLMRPMLSWGTTDRFACGKDAGRYLWKDKDFYVMNNAVDAEAFRYDRKIREKKRRELQLSDNTILVGCVGRLSEQKNPRYTLEIAEALARNQVNYKLIMIGNGELYDEVEQLIKSKHLQKYVSLMGLRQDVNEWMQAMDVFILPSRYEGLPIVGIEAQASGLFTLLSENVTPEVKLLSSVRVLSIQQDAGLWAEQIIKGYRLNAEADREKSIHDVVRAGFEINSESEKLRNYYWSLCSKRQYCGK